MKEFAIRKADINPEKKSRPQVMVLGGHTDDDAMFKLTSALDKRGIGVTIATLTNSDARNLPSYTPEELTETRWEEAKISAKIGGVTEVRRTEIPDGKLENYIEEGIAFAGDMVDDIKPIALFTPHSKDSHLDHVAASYIGELISGPRTPLYRTDTTTGFSSDGSFLTPDFYIPLTAEEAKLENEIYLANTSQVTALSDKEMRDVEAVLTMTQRRGEIIGLSHAAVVFSAKNTNETPIEDIFSKKQTA